MPTSATYTGEFDTIARERNRMSKKIQAERDAARRRNHLDDTGFPHLSSTTGLCMCLMSCCLGPGGCKCRNCPCDPDVGHLGVKA